MGKWQIVFDNHKCVSTDLFKANVMTILAKNGWNPSSELENTFTLEDKSKGVCVFNIDYSKYLEKGIITLESKYNENNMMRGVLEIIKSLK